MNFEKNQLDFFEKLSSELAFSPVPPAPEEIFNSINSSQPTHLIYTNLSSGETLRGSFYLEKSFLVYYQVISNHKNFRLIKTLKAESMEHPEIILDLSYAKLQTIFRFAQKSASKIYLCKNQNSHEIVFDDQNDYDDWMLKLSKICILTNFEKTYHIAEVNEKRGDFEVRKES